MSIFDDLNLFARLENEGDIAAIAGVTPALQADIIGLGDDLIRIGNRLKKIGADVTPIVVAGRKIQAALAPPAHGGTADSGPGFDGHSGP
jgi:hypothetical protein